MSAPVYTPAGQRIVPAREEPVGRRYYLSARVFNAAGEKVQVGGFLERPKPVEETQVEELARQLAREAGHNVPPEAKVYAGIFYPLPPVPRPPAGDVRPLLAWEIYVDFVCHDVRFASGSTEVFAWPEEPAGSVLSGYQTLVITDALCERNDGPGYVNLTEIRDCHVKPSAELPTSYR